MLMGKGGNEFVAQNLQKEVEGILVISNGFSTKPSIPSGFNEFSHQGGQRYPGCSFAMGLIFWLCSWVGAYCCCACRWLGKSSYWGKLAYFIQLRSQYLFKLLCIRFDVW